MALHSAEDPDELRATTGTVEVPTKRDNDAALAPGARPILQHEPAACHSIYSSMLHTGYASGWPLTSTAHILATP